MADNHKVFCAFKGYGDFVVACRFLREAREEHRMLCGRHLEGIHRAIGSPLDTTWIQLNSDNSFPLAYDVRRSGGVKALKSLFEIRAAVKRTAAYGTTLLFEQLTWRERIMSASCRSAEVGRTCPNIYLSYSKYMGWPEYPAQSRPPCEVRSISIFPDARLPHRVLPDGLLLGIGEQCARHGIQAKVVRVGKNPGSGDVSGVPAVWIEDFDGLVSSIRAADAIVSSDSLPGHVAEYLDVPVFTYTPWRKDFWMPGSVFLADSVGLFDDTKAFGRWLDSFTLP